MSTVNVFPPTEGKVVLELDWDDAVIVSRLIGLCNYGSLKALSPTLLDFSDIMVSHAGRNIPSEAEDYIATIRQRMVYIDRVED